MLFRAIQKQDVQDWKAEKSTDSFKPTGGQWMAVFVCIFIIGIFARIPDLYFKKKNGDA